MAATVLKALAIAFAHTLAHPREHPTATWEHPAAVNEDALELVICKLTFLDLLFLGEAISTKINVLAALALETGTFDRTGIAAITGYIAVLEQLREKAHEGLGLGHEPYDFRPISVEEVLKESKLLLKRQQVQACYEREQEVASSLCTCTLGYGRRKGFGTVFQTFSLLQEGLQRLQSCSEFRQGNSSVERLTVVQ